MNGIVNKILKCDNSAGQ